MRVPMHRHLRSSNCLIKAFQLCVQSNQGIRQVVVGFQSGKVWILDWHW